MPKPPAKIGLRTHLPEQPVQRLSALAAIAWQEGAKFIRQVEQDRAGFEHTSRRLLAIVHERRDFGIWVHPDKSTTKLVAFTDPDQPSVIFRSAVTGGQQFLQHNRNLDAVRRRQ